MISRFARLHEDERVVGAAQTRPGRFVLWCAAVVLLAWHASPALLLAALTAAMLAPSHKRAILSVAAVGVVVARCLAQLDPGPGGLAALQGAQWLPLLGGSIVLLGLLTLASHAALRFEQWPVLLRRAPLLTVHVGIWIALIGSSLPGLGFLAGAPFLAWRLSYLARLASRGKAAGTRLRDHLFYLMPVFGGSDTPIGKGLDFLSRHEARDPEAFARSQLAGLKLLLLAMLWVAVGGWMDGAALDSFGRPLTPPTGGWSTAPPRLVDLLTGEPDVAWLERWRLLYRELFRDTLSLAATGHVIVASLRLLGFNVFRNTYKPLLAESLLEFWNRYYFYFKEILVDFFFYPTYLRLRSAGLRLRLLASVFAAAFAGNMYHHLLSEPMPVVRLDFVHVWEAWGPRLVYCFLLAFGIWVSMLRQPEQRRRTAVPSLPIRMRRIAGVWTFYAIIQIWNVRQEDVGILGRLDFFLSLFGP